MDHVEVGILVSFVNRVLVVEINYVGFTLAAVVSESFESGLLGRTNNSTPRHVMSFFFERQFL